MRLAIMQPYLFPYLGYFQLLAHADRFVLYDDVAYSKNGWVNRNRILLDGQVHYLTVPVRAGLGTPIRETPVDDRPGLVRKLRAKLAAGYAKAPHRDAGLALFDEALPELDGAPRSIGDVARRSVLAAARLLRLPAAIVPSSTVYGNGGLRSVERVLDICRREGATEYCNAPGGRALYDPAVFAKAGLRLTFLQPGLPPYPQRGVAEFVPGLSILDVVMAAGPDAAREMALGGTLQP